MVDTYGELIFDASNAILVCHAFSGNHHAAGKHETDATEGWWDQMIGPGKAIDTNKYFIVCPNNLGGCAGSTGPTSINPASKEPYGGDFPVVSVSDWVITKTFNGALGYKQMGDCNWWQLRRYASSRVVSFIPTFSKQSWCYSCCS